MNANDQQLVNALRGPVIMITIGVLFLLDNLTSFQIGQTWPIFLIVLGVMALAGGSRRRYIPPAPVTPQFPGSFPPEGFENPEQRPGGEFRR
jgi:uncharacterized membrane protein YhhN